MTSLDCIPVLIIQTQSPLFALAEFGDYLEVFKSGGVAFDCAVGGLQSKGLFHMLHMRIALEARR